MSDFVVASTTDTQEAVNQAAGAIKEPETEPKEQKESEPEQKEIQKDPESPKDSPTRGEQKRIDRLTREKYELQERLAALEARVNQQAAPPAEVKPEPVQSSAILPEKFPPMEEWIKDHPDESYEDYIDARGEWRIEKRLAKMAAEEEMRSAQEAQRAVKDAYDERVEEFKKTHADWKEVIDQDLTLPPGVGETILQMENGPEVAYYFGKHPDAAKRLNQMNPYSAIAEVGRIAATLGRDEAINNPGFRTDKIPTSNAPAPIKPLTGHSTKSTKSLDELDYQEYRKARDQQERNKYRR